MTDYKRIKEKEYEKICKQLPPNTLVIIREYNHPHKDKHIAAIVSYCKKQQRPFLIAQDHRLAIKHKANGIHLPEHAIHRAPMIKKQHPTWVITAAVHSNTALKKAEKTKAIDAVLISPVFQTKSDLNKKVVNKYLFINMLKKVRVPVFALGGVNKTTIPQLKNSKCYGISGIETFLEHKRHTGVA